MVDFFKKNKILVGLAVFVVAVLYVFLPVLGKYAALHAPDSMPFFSYKYGSVVWANVMGGQTAFTPHTLYWLIFNPLYAHELTYIIDTLVLSLGALYYLRGRGVSPLAAWCGALALGFSGYTFTLFCAGHRGYFHMFSCAVWAFGLIDRGFSKKKLIYFALTGLVFAWGIPYQPDVFIFVAATAALYAFWLTFKQSTPFLKTALSVWPRFLVMLVFLVMAGYNAIHSAVTDRIADRKAQMAGVSRSSDSKTDGSKSEADPKVSPKEQWLFATNWSLPPEDMLEFIVPGVFGDESFHGDHPYWGRLGQPHKSVFQKGRMMPNYRQHTVYLGVVAFIFSLFAIVSYFNVRKLPEEEAEEKAVFRDVPFWAGIFIVCLLLAFGRFTPFYRIFYAIPYMDLIRAPVKFLHIVEIASALLCGYGVHALLVKKESFARIKSRFIWVAGVSLALLIIVALVFTASKSGIVEHVKSFGMIRNAAGTADYALRNLGRSMLFVVPLLISGWFLRKNNNSKFVLVFAYLVLVAIAIDQSLVARRYVKVFDVQPYYYENVVVKALKKDSTDSIPRVFSYLPPTQNEWFRKSLAYNGIVNLRPSQSQMKSDYARVINALQRNPKRLWQVLNAKYLILPFSSAAQLVKSGSARPLASFELAGAALREVQQPNEKAYALVALNGVSQKPRLLSSWTGGVDKESQIKQVASSKTVLSDAAPPSDKAGSAGEVEILFEQRILGDYSVGVKTKSAVESLLVINRPKNLLHEVLVDGVVVDEKCADGIWVAVEIPSGEHDVVIRRGRKPLAFVFSLFAIFVFCVIGIVCALNLKSTLKC